MSLAENIINLYLEATEYDWKKAKDGYELLSGDIKLVKKGKMWSLQVKDIGEIKLGKKASFDTANKALDKVLKKI